METAEPAQVQPHQYSSLLGLIDSETVHYSEPAQVRQPHQYSSLLGLIDSDTVHYSSISDRLHAAAGLSVSHALFEAVSCGVRAHGRAVVRLLVCVWTNWCVCQCDVHFFFFNRP